MYHTGSLITFGKEKRESLFYIGPISNPGNSKKP